MVKVLAHRGYSSKYPENSLTAFKKAFETDADGIECDIQKCKDDKFVIIHDDCIDEVSSGAGKINEMTLKELRSCDACEGEGILELEEFLSSVPNNKIINIEIKKETISESDCPSIYKIIIKHIKKENLLISSFSDKYLYYFRNKGINVGYLLGEESKKMGIMGSLNVLFKLRPQYINLPYRMFKELGVILSYLFLFFLKLFRRKILFWVIDTDLELKKILKFSDCIITNRPEYIVNIIKKE